MKQLIFMLFFLISCGDGGSGGGGVAAETSKDTTAPVVVNKDLTAVVTSVNNITIYWEPASDEISTQEKQLTYVIYYSYENNISSVSEIIANGKNYGAKINGTEKSYNFILTDLLKLNNIYINILVNDEAGNKASYNTYTVTNESALGELYIIGQRDSQALSEKLTSVNDSLNFYETYLIINSCDR